ncbi:MAG TPA: XylR family transcriptional regulator [Bryobacteraceae bacterium]|nr:XylR family transcriptional regulator [Bryobacteraceae bacterium]
MYDARLAYDVKVMIGIGAWIHEHGNWSVYIKEDALKDQHLPDLASWDGDGIIANFDDRAIFSAVTNSRLPSVAFGGGGSCDQSRCKVPYFFGDDEAIARLAADHLLSRGLRSFAYCGYPRDAINGWSERRAHAFCARVAQRGFKCEVYRSSQRTEQEWVALRRSISSWLTTLPRPLGLMAANDRRGRQVLEACRALGLRVPDEVAVIGVDNDELFCQMSSPPLSSVEHGAKELGYRAAALLEEMMTGRKAERRRYVIPPVGVVTRQSTNVLAVQEPKVREAMSFIADTACHGIKVRNVAEIVGLSRSALEKRFKATLGYTVPQAIRRVQLERARLLIVETKLPLKQVADNTGFRSVQHLTTVFGNTFGQPPARYRKSGHV